MCNTPQEERASSSQTWTAKRRHHQWRGSSLRVDRLRRRPAWRPRWRGRSSGRRLVLVPSIGRMMLKDESAAGQLLRHCSRFRPHGLEVLIVCGRRRGRNPRASSRGGRTWYRVRTGELVCGRSRRRNHHLSLTSWCEICLRCLSHFLASQEDEDQHANNPNSRHCSNRNSCNGSSA